METIVKVEFWGVISQQSSGFGGSNAAAFFCCCFVCG